MAVSELEKKISELNNIRQTLENDNNGMLVAQDQVVQPYINIPYMHTELAACIHVKLMFLAL